MADYLELYRQFEPPVGTFDRSLLGPEFPRELSAASRLWTRCGYAQGIASYLNFFLLKDFIVTHDTAYPPRFQSFQSMAKSFYQTDLFIRDVTDSGLKPTGGISSSAVRRLLASIMQRHRRINIPPWMMTYFGFSLVEMVEKVCAPVDEEEKQLHFSYMGKAYRIMGLSFSSRRDWMDRFSRQVEAAHAGLSPHVEQHARNILILGEMVGVSSGCDNIASTLPEKTRVLFRALYPRVRPSLVKRLAARASGRFLVPRAVGAPRHAVPAAE
jgi:hypothetical protein